MEANELMIGDWVKNRLCKNGYAQVKLESFVCHSRWEDGCACFNFGNVEPIPITEEILKANGWTLLYHYDRESYYSENGEFNLNFHCGRFFRLFANSKVVNIKYVHQLQHALRLCGLNDIADNFKI